MVLQRRCSVSAELKKRRNQENTCIGVFYLSNEREECQRGVKLPSEHALTPSAIDETTLYVSKGF